MPSSRISQPQVVILGALTALAPFSIDTYLPGLPDLARTFHTSASATQLTLTACLLGLAVGQLVAGPLSDSYGRRRPLLAGLAVYTLASLLCALAPSIWALATFRFVQGAAGAGGIVISKAIARDRTGGTASARLFATLALVTGLAPMLAPVVGAQVLQVTSWRGVFVVLAGLGAVLFTVTATGLAESLPAGRRHRGGVSATLRVFRGLLADRTVLGCALALGFAAGAMFAYISGGPFVLQDIYGLSPQAYSVAFAVNAVGFIAASQFGGRVVHRTGPRVLLLAGVAMCAVGGIAAFVALAAHAGLGMVLPTLFVTVTSMGLTFPNAIAHALADQAGNAGAAAALLGLAQFLFGALAAPVVGSAGTDTALPMGITIAVLGVAAAAACVFLVPRQTGRNTQVGKATVLSALR
ncbi:MULTISPECIES: multidrug effflux MFS transporter [unclassified Parafrankia]|uniref:multidrug effflux MFS transporter n=1 Tax=unclassified Parafrankia TaxID=2994368 RepID=UPI000DA4C854|nr:MULTISPECIES: multidrug effflux MFS transporter [unclassified Parafrankia]TCJ32260.1 Bcr/CflA family efflux MFS transporter [Parafrankia sp. BMG5.11]SQD93853.1 Drug resistance transporter, Bcr/CflA subfamily [Parafrankia sp. Ea1.12]